MSALLRLYPPAWRERYGDELVALLEDHPATLLDRLDLIRGAFDARLHPQVPGSTASTDKGFPMNSKTYAVMAIAGGVIWMLAIASFFVLTTPGGDRADTVGSIGLAIAMSLISIPLGELGNRAGSRTSRWTGTIVAIAGIALASTLLMPWPLMTIALLGFPPFAIVAVSRGVFNRAFPAWFALFPVAVCVAVLGASGLLGEVGHLALALVGPAAFVLAWLAYSPIKPHHDSTGVTLA
jgi:hypothetical protein